MRYDLLLLASHPLLLGLLAPGARAQSPLYSFYGDVPFDDFGHGVGHCGDVNGDGFGDVVVGATQVDIPSGWVARGNGYARVFSGRDGAILHDFRGDALNDRMGLFADGVLDADGDGLADVAVTLNNHDGNGADAGAVRVYSGADGSLLHTFLGDQPGDHLGSSVAGIGDLDGDGRGEILTGAAQPFVPAPGKPGYARVFSGADGSVLFTLGGDQAQDWFGKSVDGAGDVDGDGTLDFIVGAQGIYDGTPPPDGTGYARVFSGADGSVLHTFTGMTSTDWFGWSVGCAGDFDRDGFSDLLVGAQDRTGQTGNTGYARVFSGADGGVLATFTGDAASDGFGFSVDGAGDVNLDGHGDVLIGAWQSYPGSGYARVLSGADGSILHTFRGGAPNDGLGRAVAGGGDVDADGVPDIVCGTFVGYASVYSGAGFACAASAQAYGQGLAGSDGLVPRVAVPGCSSIGKPLSFHVTNARAGARGLLVLGFSAASRPAYGGTILVARPWVRFPSVLAGDPAIPGSGWGSLSLSIPADPGLVGRNYFLQAGYLDAGAPQGVSLSAGLRSTVGM